MCQVRLIRARGSGIRSSVRSPRGGSRTRWHGRYDGGLPAAGRQPVEEGRRLGGDTGAEPGLRAGAFEHAAQAGAAREADQGEVAQCRHRQGPVALCRQPVVGDDGDGDGLVDHDIGGGALRRALVRRLSTPMSNSPWRSVWSMCFEVSSVRANSARGCSLSYDTGQPVPGAARDLLLVACGCRLPAGRLAVPADRFTAGLVRPAARKAGRGGAAVAWGPLLLPEEAVLCPNRPLRVPLPYAAIRCTVGRGRR